MQQGLRAEGREQSVERLGPQGLKPACTFCGIQVNKIPFLEAEEDGVGPPRSCPRCKSSKPRSDRNRSHAEPENAQVEIIRVKDPF